jgi:hypothetical protein
MRNGRRNYQTGVCDTPHLGLGERRSTDWEGRVRIDCAKVYGFVEAVATQKLAT